MAKTNMRTTILEYLSMNIGCSEDWQEWYVNLIEFSLQVDVFISRKTVSNRTSISELITISY